MSSSSSVINNDSNLTVSSISTFVTAEDIPIIQEREETREVYDMSRSENDHD